MAPKYNPGIQKRKLSERPGKKKSENDEKVTKLVGAGGWGYNFNVSMESESERTNSR